MAHSPLFALDHTNRSPGHPEGSTQLDIYVYVVHSHTRATDLRELINRIFGVLEWGILPAVISVVVADNCDLAELNDTRVKFVRASDAAAKFLMRCQELEAGPHDVLVCFGTCLPTIDVIGQLQTTLRGGEMAGAAVPRIAVEPFGHLVALGDHPDPPATRLVDRKQCCDLAPIYFMQEDLFPCFCIAKRIIGNIDPPQEFTHFPEAAIALLRAGRRRGFLLLVDNNAVLSVPEYVFDKRAMLEEQDKMRELFKDYAAVQKRLADHPAVAQERRMKVSGNGGKSAPTLLLDCTGMSSILNGTTEYVLGVLGGINKNGTGGWKVSAMVPKEATRHFSLDGRFPTIDFLPKSNTQQFDVAIRLSQAWSLAMLSDLSRRARSIAITILDTIGPDIVYAVPPGSEEAFQFAGEHADGLIYISQFSQRQFKRRYVTHADLIELVIYPSLDPVDYVSDDRPAPRQGEWILLFGNNYDHKDLSRTTKILATAFPFESFKVVGIEYSEMSNVEGSLSGNLDSDAIEELYQKAKYVVFPSFYEGFGFPLVRGLAHGKTVMARFSKLLHEIAENMPDSGRLIGFDNSLDLVTIVARLLRGEDYPSLALGINLWAETGPHSWLSCGDQLLAFANRLRASEKQQRWLQRDRALHYALRSIER